MILKLGKNQAYFLRKVRNSVKYCQIAPIKVTAVSKVLVTKEVAALFDVGFTDDAGLPEDDLTEVHEPKKQSRSHFLQGYNHKLKS